MNFVREVHKDVAHAKQYYILRTLMVEKGIYDAIKIILCHNFFLNQTRKENLRNHKLVTVTKQSDFLSALNFLTPLVI